MSAKAQKSPLTGEMHTSSERCAYFDSAMLHEMEFSRRTFANIE